MGLNKKDRRISIWIGVIIGVTISSLLFRYAINDKNERASKRPGSYESNMTAVGYHTFPGIPNSIRDAIPHGLVLHYESNFSIFEETSSKNVCWVIESSGALRSERLFILAELDPSETPAFYLASEMYITASENTTFEMLEQQLPEENFRILGQNQRTSEYILQIKEFDPRKFREVLRQLPKKFKSIKQVRPYPWSPSG
ncbi:MAG: hypothetical protein EBS13_02940 [Verrucomicrobia bacterium]|nr:hypothetical protein [Verrucomicrobiota bacterium]